MIDGDPRGGCPDTVVGLRVDVDTFRGTRDGVPNLLDVLARHHVLATFFFSVGPDNMGRHLWRCFNPAFLSKMLRSHAPDLYGWDIVLRGTLWPGPRIAEKLGYLIRDTSTRGHEVGLHAWDHHRWQSRVAGMGNREIRAELHRGVVALNAALGRSPQCSAAAGWRCTANALLESNRYQFRYNSDCRGTSIFCPLVDDVRCTPQIPVTLPTYDELIGRDSCDDSNYNSRLLDMIDPGRLNVLAVHAEVEGISKRQLFDDFLERASRRSISFVPLGTLLPTDSVIPDGRLAEGRVAGREGWISVQDSAR